MAYMNVMPTPKQLCDSNGDPLNGGKVYCYAVGGGFSTPKTTYPTYDDAVAGTNANAHPVVLDSAGRANIWISGDADIRVKTSAGVTVYSEENINPDQSTAVVQLQPGRIAAATNLAVAKASNSQVDFTADNILLLNSAGESTVQAFTSTVSVFITSSGVNGLDAGSEAISTWYYIWAIWNGTLKRGLLSASSSSPTMPTGYTHKALIGCVRNNAAGNFDNFVQRGDRVVIDEVILITNGTDSSATEVSASAFVTNALTIVVPPLAKEVYGSLQISRTSGTSAVTANVQPGNAGTGLGVTRIAADGGTGTTTAETRNAYTCVLTTPQTMYYTVTTSNTSLDITVSGYRY